MALQITEDIKKLLGAEVLSKLEEAAKESDVFIASGKDYVPKGRFDEVNNQVKELKTANGEYEKKLTETLKGAKSQDELTAQITALQKERDDQKVAYEKQIADRELDYQVNDALKGYKAKNVKAVVSLIDKTKISVKDGALVGLKEQIEPLMKSDAYLFGDQEEKPKVDKFGHEIKEMPGLGNKSAQDFAIEQGYITKGEAEKINK